MSVEGKVGIITGGSKGMGRHFVTTLIAAGAKIACFARPSPESDSLARELGDDVLVIPCDVRDMDQVDAAVARTVEHFDKLDFLVNNAAIFHPFRLEDARPEQIEQHVGINLLGPIWCIRAAIPHLRATKGTIVSVSSESVRMPYPYLSVYAATKGGLETLTAAMREELRDAGIRSTILRSGSVAGGSGAADWDPEVGQAFLATIQRTGHVAFSGAAAQPQSMAQALANVLSLPADVNVDLIEVRATLSAGA
ncbi:MAG: SDR family oxidoreductase [Sphingobium sp.]